MTSTNQPPTTRPPTLAPDWPAPPDDATRPPILLPGWKLPTDARNWQHYANPLRPLKGRSLRFIVVDHIRNHGTMTVAEMVAALAADGHHLTGRPSKVISDALRWEVARGRVQRIARGVYRYGKVPRTTARRIRLLATLSRAWLNAVANRTAPTPTPDTPHQRWLIPCARHDCPIQHEDPGRPPWTNLNWLWTT